MILDINFYLPRSDKGTKSKYLLLPFVSLCLRGKYFIILCVAGSVATAQDTVRYIGETVVNIDYHHGQLQPAIGVHNIQTMRANREHPDQSEGFGWTYNHAPMLAYWN